MSTNLSLTDINPLEHITGDIAISQYNYESIMKGLVQWNMSKLDNVTIRVATRTDPYFVDYVIPTKYFYDRTYGNVASETLLDSGLFAYNNREQIGIAKDDNMVVRVSVSNNGGVNWAIYKDITVYDEYTKELDTDGMYVISANQTYMHSYIKGLYFRLYNADEHTFELYRTIGDINVGDAIATNAEKVVYESDTVSVPVTSIVYDIIVCKATNEVYALNPGHIPEGDIHLNNRNIDYGIIGETFTVDKTSFKKGELVYFRGNLYICIVNSTVLPPAIVESEEDDKWTFNTDQWAEVLPLRLNKSAISSSINFRTNADTDISGFILRNISDDVTSDDNTRITISSSVSYPGTTTTQPTGLDIIPTSNYVNWPESDAGKWMPGTTYSTDVGKDAYCKQDYSAVMVFNHNDPDIRYKNIINYDGPDLDQGLCIMLPVTVHDENNQTHDPVDGCMFEFMFNIWPNHDYDSRDVNDLIINKSQIYVYNIPDTDDFNVDSFNNSTVEPIAKFSMARVMNFYVESENIGVPDRPVCYKARFIYSQAEHRWKTYDYYQLPDHVFMSPHGFVDPSTQESAGFPLYQNPFSDYDLSAIPLNSNTRNQYQEQLDEE